MFRFSFQYFMLPAKYNYSSVIVNKSIKQCWIEMQEFIIDSYVLPLLSDTGFQLR